MTRIDPRFARQARLAEIGVEGQARLAAYTAEIGLGSAGDVAALYLVRAGTGVHRKAAPSTQILAEDAPVHADARAFAEGAALALHHVRTALGMI